MSAVPSWGLVRGECQLTRNRDMTQTDIDWDIRLFIYKSLVASGRAPDVQAISAQFGIASFEARVSLRRLQDAHALALRAGSSDILMANPLSAIPTDYRVRIGDTTLYANCAWDSLGIPAMLGADARIKARHPLTRDVIEYRVKDRQLQTSREYLVHFAKPFRNWYDDIVDT